LGCEFAVDASSFIIFATLSIAKTILWIANIIERNINQLTMNKPADNYAALLLVNLFIIDYSFG